MALSRRSGARLQANVWPGFVDAMTALLLVLTFVLTIFMVVQFVLRDQLDLQGSELDELTGEVLQLSSALGLERDRSSALGADLDAARSEAGRQADLIAALNRRVEDGEAAVASFEAQVASLIAERDEARDTGVQQADRIAALESDADALNLALASARSEIDTAAEEARRAAAEREAFETLIADLRSEAETRATSLADAAAALAAAEGSAAAAQDQVASLTERLEQSGARSEALEASLSEEEAARLREAAAAEALGRRLSEAQLALSDEEKARLAEAAAAEALRKKLEDSEAELTAMTLALERERKSAEDTLTLLAAARAVEGDLNERLAGVLTRAQSAETVIAQMEDEAGAAVQTMDGLRADLAAARLRAEEAETRAAALEDDARANGATAADLRSKLADAVAARALAERASDAAMTDAERQEALLAVARDELEGQRALTDEEILKTEALNRQVADLRAQIEGLQDALGVAQAADEAKGVQITNLGQELNSALARAASEAQARAEAAERELDALGLLDESERKVAILQAAERERLERSASTFFGTLRDVLEGREGVRVVGDRFVFSSEVLFEPGSANLSAEGRAQIASIAGLIDDVSESIPPSIDWILRVDGHTDDIPLTGGGRYRDNWELSQARALSVVRYMIDGLGVDPWRLSANGFGENRPLNPSDTPEARAQNRRIELKFTER